VTEITRGNVLVGNFSLSIVNPDTGVFYETANVSVGASASELDAAIESTMNGSDGRFALGFSEVTRLVEVSREIVDKYGSRNFVITFTENSNNAPLGAGDIPLLVVSNETIFETATANGTGYICEACEGPTANARVVETQKGSTGLGGFFDLNLGSASNGPVQVWLNETDAAVVESDVEMLATIGDVHVTVAEIGAGWDGSAVAVDGTRGGYMWTVRFVENFGATNGRSFPPGSGDVDPLSATFAVSLNGTNAAVGVRETVRGSESLSGRFSIEVDGAVSELPGVNYDASASEMDAALEDLATVGSVSVQREYRMASPVPRADTDSVNATSG